jgi:serine/threonine protein kinase
LLVEQLSRILAEWAPAGLCGNQEEDRKLAAALEELMKEFGHLWQHMTPQSRILVKPIVRQMRSLVRGLPAGRLPVTSRNLLGFDGSNGDESLSPHGITNAPTVDDQGFPDWDELRGMWSSLERYTILRQIGSGGMSTVYLAHDNLLAQEVALKLMHRGLRGEPGMLARFRRETALARELRHPNICPVFDMGELEATCYISMKYIDGITLKRRIAENGALETCELVNTASQVLLGLAAAHRILVHRDLKPQNIMFDREGCGYLLDFGLACARIDAASAPGRLIGTPGYVAPEQIEGKIADTRSDLYSFGVILFEMATGQPPFRARTIEDILRMHMTTDPPRPSSLRSGLPAGLDQLILSLLAKRPDNRPRTAEEVLRTLCSSAAM